MSEWKKGDRVTVVGLQGLGHYSGKAGTYTGERTGSGLYRIHLDLGTHVAVAPNNMRKLDVMTAIVDDVEAHTPLRKLVKKWQGQSRVGPSNDRAIYGACAKELLDVMRVHGIK